MRHIHVCPGDWVHRRRAAHVGMALIMVAKPHSSLRRDRAGTPGRPAPLSTHPSALCSSPASTCHPSKGREAGDRGRTEPNAASHSWHLFGTRTTVSAAPCPRPEDSPDPGGRRDAETKLNTDARPTEGTDRLGDYFFWRWLGGSGKSRSRWPIGLRTRSGIVRSYVLHVRSPEPDA